MSDSASFAITAPVAPRTVSADRAMHWLNEGWRIFTAAPGVWIAIFVVTIVIQVVLTLVPVIGGIASAILTPVFVGGLMAGCASAVRGEPLQFDCLFQGFRHNTGNLVIIGVLYLVGVIAISVIGLTVLLAGGGGAMLSVLAHSAADPGTDQLLAEMMMSSVGIILLATCVVLVLFVPLLMALWFAPALAMLDHVAPAAAMKSSLSASLRNWLPLTVYGVVALVLMVVAAIPFMLGYLVLIPVLMGSVYASYHDIYSASS